MNQPDDYNTAWIFFMKQHDTWEDVIKQILLFGNARAVVVNEKIVDAKVKMIFDPKVWGLHITIQGKTENLGNNEPAD